MATEAALVMFRGFPRTIAEVADIKAGDYAHSTYHHSREETLCLCSGFPLPLD